MLRRLSIACALAFAPVVAGPAAAMEVDLELVLAVDMSGSMDPEEHALQRQGYVDAIAHPHVAAVIARGAYGRIALSYLEWAGPSAQVVVMDWTVIDGPQAAADFSAALAARPLSLIRGTSISGAIDFAAAMIAGNAYEGWRKVIDVSGDGPNNRGRPVSEARDDALAAGIAINGLPLMLRPSASGGDLAAYYRDCVTGGPGAFVLPVRDEAEIATAIRRKLVLEVAGGPPPAVPAQASPTVDCLVGERLRRVWDY
jgi:hypothetical protein